MEPDYVTCDCGLLCVVTKTEDGLVYWTCPKCGDLFDGDPDNDENPPLVN